MNETEKQFIKELTDLLKRWNAEIEAEDHYPGYAECGEDVRMTARLDGLYNERGELIREPCEINLEASIG